MEDSGAQRPEAGTGDEAAVEHIRGQADEGRVGAVPSSSEDHQFRPLKTGVHSRADGSPSEIDHILQLRLRAGDPSRAQDEHRSPRELFERHFGPCSDDDWQWLKEFTERYYMPEMQQVYKRPSALDDFDVDLVQQQTRRPQPTNCEDRVLMLVDIGGKVKRFMCVICETWVTERYYRDWMWRVDAKTGYYVRQGQYNRHR